jgi:2'-5' RNA ligase
MQLYFAALLLPADAASRINEVKDYFAERYGWKVALRSPAHITLIPPFRMHPSMEEEWCTAMDALCIQLQTISIDAKGWGHFGKRTLFLEPQLTPGLSALKKAADNFVRAHPQFGASVDDRRFHPHVTVANRDIGPGEFAEALAWLETQSFPRSWEAAGITTLRYGQKKWDVWHTSRFV